MLLLLRFVLVVMEPEIERIYFRRRLLRRRERFKCGGGGGGGRVVVMKIIGIMRYGMGIIRRRVVIVFVIVIILIVVIILQRSCGGCGSCEKWLGSRGQVDTEWIEGGRRGVGVGFETIVEQVVIVVVSCRVSGGCRAGRWGVRCRCRRR